VAELARVTARVSVQNRTIDLCRVNLLGTGHGCEATIQNLGSIPRNLLHILSYHDSSNIRPVRMTGVFHSLGVFASGNLRGVLGGEAAISFQHGIVGTADFVEKCNRCLVLSSRDAKLGELVRGEKINRKTHA
jgi:hypothetical protein